MLKKIFLKVILVFISLLMKLVKIYFSAFLFKALKQMFKTRNKKLVLTIKIYLFQLFVSSLSKLKRYFIKILKSEKSCRKAPYPE